MHLIAVSTPRLFANNLRRFSVANNNGAVSHARARAGSPPSTSTLIQWLHAPQRPGVGTPRTETRPHFSSLHSAHFSLYTLQQSPCSLFISVMWTGWCFVPFSGSGACTCVARAVGPWSSPKPQQLFSTRVHTEGYSPSGPQSVSSLEPKPEQVFVCMLQLGNFRAGTSFFSPFELHRLLHLTGRVT